MKKCSCCGEKNPEDFRVCKNCGKLLDNYEQGIGIKVGIKTIIVVFVIILFIFIWLGMRIYDKIAYTETGLPDKKYNMDVVNFKIPAKWIPIGKVFYNPKSIPNLLTFFVAAVNPQEDVDFQFFSTQFETSDNLVFSDNENDCKINELNYFSAIVKKISPSAENIKIIKIEKPSKKEIKQAKEDENFFISLYTNINPGTTKGQSWIEDIRTIPVHYIFSYEDKGEQYYQLLEGRFVSFVQYFSKSVTSKSDLRAKIRYTKCENIFSYRAPVKYFDKNMRKYETFKSSLKKNPEWMEYSYSERRQLLASSNFLTTESLAGGDKFDTEAFKNMVYTIEYLDKASVQRIKDMYKIDFKTFFINLLE